MTSFPSVWLSGLGVVLVLAFGLWLVSLAKRDASIVDVFWGPGFVVLAAVYAALTQGWPPRRALVLACVALWGVRLAAHIAWRARGRGEDYRYGEMRARHGARFARVSLFTVFFFQAALMWLLSAPLLAALRGTDTPSWNFVDALASSAFAVGLLFETVGDLQLARFRADPANRGKVLRSGLWGCTRHPNYFGDAVVWWSFFLFALADGDAWWTVYAPLLMTFLLLRVSGVTLLEKKLASTRPDYADYAARTSAFVPWFPAGGGGRR